MKKFVKTVKKSQNGKKKNNKIDLNFNYHSKYNLNERGARIMQYYRQY